MVTKEGHRRGHCSALVSAERATLHAWLRVQGVHDMAGRPEDKDLLRTSAEPVGRLYLPRE